MEGTPYMTTTNFAPFLPGPGTSRPVHSPHGGESDVGVASMTTFHVSNKDRTFVDVISY